jgi:hypothetical protein
MATVADVITDALMDLGVLAEEQTPNASQSAQGLRRLVRFLKLCRTENLYIPIIARVTATLTPSAPSFTVGTGGNINIIRPGLQQVEKVNYLDNSLSTPLEVSLGPLMTEAEYEAIPLKTQTSTRPVRAYYSPTYSSGFGTLIPWPISTGASLLWVVYYHAAIADYAAISDTVTVPDGYEQFLVKSLAMELAPSFQRQVPPELRMQAAEARRMVTRSNQRAVELNFDFNGGGQYDIKSDRVV